MTTPRQATIERAGEISGTGLHSGAPVTMRILPGAADSGIVFRRIDLPGSPEVRAALEHVVGTDRGTTIGDGEGEVGDGSSLRGTSERRRKVVQDPRNSAGRV